MCLTPPTQGWLTWTKCLTSLACLPFTTLWWWGAGFAYNLHKRKLNHRGMKRLGECHPASQRQSQNSVWSQDCMVQRSQAIPTIVWGEQETSTYHQGNKLLPSMCTSEWTHISVYRVRMSGLDLWSSVCTTKGPISAGASLPSNLNTHCPAPRESELARLN